jgi:hypothetical protein
MAAWGLPHHLRVSLAEANAIPRVVEAFRAVVA